MPTPNAERIITKSFAVPTFLVKRMHRSFAIGTLLRKPPARTTPMDRLLISRAFLHTSASCHTGLPTLLMSPKMKMRRK